MKEILLSQYSPKCQLALEEHHLLKPKFPVFDVHTHMGKLLMGEDYETKYNIADFVKMLDYHNVKTIVNLDGFWGNELDKMLKVTEGYEDRILTFGWVDTSIIDDPNFAKLTENAIKEAYKKGIKGLKLWKNISLGQKDKTGKYIRIDDKRLQPIWDTAAELNIPILIHIADPKAFFEEVDEHNEWLDLLIKHPDWSFCDPKFYRFDELMEMQENMLYSNPHTTFIVAHAGSCAEDLKYVGRCLDSYSNMYIDTAARINELGRQPYTARDFLIKYQDRVLFGTDTIPVAPASYDIHYRFFETKDEYFKYSKDEIPTDGRWSIYGVYLPDEVLEKIYYKNAERLILKHTK